MIDEAENTGEHLLRRGYPDEAVERATGLTLLEIISIRVTLASRPWLPAPIEKTGIGLYEDKSLKGDS